MIRRFVLVSLETAAQLVFALPRYRTLNRLKSSFLRVLGAEVGERVIFYPGVWIVTGRNLRLGDDVDLARDVLITTDGGVAVGDRVLVGYRTQILSSNHNIPPRDEKIFAAGHTRRPVVIEDDSWIAAGCVVLPGVRIGEGAVVGAGSVVTRDVPPFSVVAGVPARIIGHRPLQEDVTTDRPGRLPAI